jgi:hypothetical protein
LTGWERREVCLPGCWKKWRWEAARLGFSQRKGKALVG